MKYLEFTFRTVPCTEIVNDVLSGVLGEAGFESFVEQTDGITAYIQKELYNESLLKEALADFPLPDTQIEYNFIEAEDKDWNVFDEIRIDKFQTKVNRQELLPAHRYRRPLCHSQHFSQRCPTSRI